MKSGRPCLGVGRVRDAPAACCWPSVGGRAALAAAGALCGPAVALDGLGRLSGAGGPLGPLLRPAAGLRSAVGLLLPPRLQFIGARGLRACVKIPFSRAPAHTF
jgi:hypothetical protein